MFNRVCLLAAVAGSVVATPAFSQLVHRAIGTAQQEIAYGLTANRDCGFAITGSRALNTTAATTILISGLDASGTVLWSSQFRPPEGRSRGTAIQQTSDGGYIIGAETAFGGSTVGKYLLRTNSTGGLLWSFLYTGTPFVGALNVGVGVRELSDLSLASVNRLQVAGVPSAGVYTRVASSTGAPIVNNSYSFAGPASQSYLDFADLREWRGVANPPSDNLFIVGHAREFTVAGGFGSYVAFAARLDAAGTVTWARTYKHPALDMTADGFCFTRDGDLVVSGRLGTGIAQAGPSDLAVLRIRAVDGGVDWSVAATAAITRFTNAPRGVEFLSGSDEVVIAGGTETSAAVLFRNASAAVFDANTGAFQRAKPYGRFDTVLSNSAANALAIASPYGHVTLAGATTDIGFGGSDVKFIRGYTSLDTGCRQADLTLTSTPFTPTIEAKQLVATAGGVAQVFTQSGVPTITDIAACSTPRCVGDLNADGLVDDADFSVFAAAYDALVCPSNPAFNCCPADFNNDTFVDDADFTLFASAYNDLLCP
ncbi:MAG: hypothetical protein K2Y21_12080 [Phycisphaerales bacterium]|nr:hypothetical protein [Phycisphaerales bacterium]